MKFISYLNIERLFKSYLLVLLLDILANPFGQSLYAQEIQVPNSSSEENALKIDKNIEI